MRLLEVVRLSHLTAETLSPEVQHDKIGQYAGLYGHTVVGSAEDIDVSGAVSVWNRDLAPWLEDPERIALWDAVIVAKLDRLTRSIGDFADFIDWCDKHGKTIISVAENLDFSSAAGRLFAGILVQFAQFERERMSERRRDRYQADVARGWFGGGWTKYGFKAVKVDSHYELAEDAEEKAVVYRMADDLLHGKSATQIARELEADNIPTKRGGKWDSNTIYGILRDPESVLDTETWSQLQPVINAAKRPKVNRYNAAMLSGVVMCASCDTPMWAQHTKRGDQVWNYYRCYNKCGAKMIRAADLEAAVNEDMTDPEGNGGVYRLDRIRIPGNDRQRLLDDIDRQLAELLARFTAKAITREEYRSKSEALLTEQERVEQMPVVEDSYDWKPTDQTVAMWWEGLTDQGKRHWLQTQGWKIWAKAGEHRGEEPIVTIEQPPIYLSRHTCG